MDKGIRNKAIVAGVIVAVFMIPIILMSSPTLMFFGGYSGTTIIVDENGNGDYTVLQTAITNADEGDTIRIWDGSYSTFIGNVATISTDGLALVGNGSSTIIDGGGLNNGIVITADNISIRELTIDDCSGAITVNHGYDDISLDNLTVTNSNNGISVGSTFVPSDWSYNIQITNCEVSGIGGFAIGLYSCVDSYVRDCSVDDIGENIAIYLLNECDSVDIEDCTILDGVNGVYISDSESITVSDCDISGIYGQAIRFDIGTDCIFGNNTVYGGGPLGILMTSNSDDNLFYNNNISGFSTGMNLNSGTGNTFVYNSFRDSLPTAFSISTGGNSFYLNNFINNVNHNDGSGGSNVWNRSAVLGGGNYWDSWDTPDVDVDGFVDSAFLSSGVLDLLPLASPAVAPVPGVEEDGVSDIDMNTGQLSSPDDDVGDVLDDDKPGAPVDGDDGGIVAIGGSQLTVSAILIGAEAGIVIGAIIVDIFWVPKTGGNNG